MFFCLSRDIDQLLLSVPQAHNNKPRDLAHSSKNKIKKVASLHASPLGGLAWFDFLFCMSALYIIPCHDDG